MPEQFYSLTFSQYTLKCKGYLSKIDKENWMTRWAVWYTVYPHVKNMPPMEKILPLASDKAETPEQMANRLKERLKRAGREFNNG